MTKQQRLVVVIAILGSFVAFLDSSVVNVALPAIAKNLGGGLVAQQWVVDAYLLTLGSLIMIAGSLSDLLGRKRVLKLGLISFGIFSVICASATTSSFLTVARAFQGVAGALLVPSSLALIISSFERGSGQSKAIGTWTAWTGIAFIVGPLFGGFLVDAISWRAIFLINVIPIAITLYLLQHLKQPENINKGTKIDYLGAVMCTLGLSGSVYALIEQPSHGWSSPLIYVPLVIGLLLLIGFVYAQKVVKSPMLPLDLFKIRNFSVGNIATLAIYAGLSVTTFLIVVAVQQLGHYSAFEAGLAFLPVTIIMFIMSPRFGALAGKYGPRFFMSVGPIVAGIGLALLLRMSASANYLTQILPGVVVFGIGLATTVAPLTAAILGDIPSRHAGIGSAVNNAVARIAGLIAIATIGLIVGVKLTIAGFHRGVIAMSALVIIGGLISLAGIVNTNSARKPAETNPE